MTSPISHVKNILSKFNNLNRPKKVLILLIVALIVVVVLTALDIIPKDTIFPASTSQVLEPTYEPTPETPHQNEVVPGWFKGGGTISKLSGPGATPANSLDECVEIAKMENAQNGTGIIIAGFRNSKHSIVKYKNTCYFLKNPTWDSYDKNDSAENDGVHSMTCINDVSRFEDCA